MHKEAGFKNSGIISLKNKVLELKSTERIETILLGKEKLDKEHTKALVKEANIKLRRTKEK